MEIYKLKRNNPIRYWFGYLFLGYPLIGDNGALYY